MFVGSLLTLLSVLPVIPWLLSYAAPWLTRRTVVRVVMYDVPLESLKLWWFTMVLGTFLCVFVLSRISESRMDKRRQTWLPPPQMRFACCYAIVDEIRQYETNHLQKHLDSALQFWPMLVEYLRTMLRSWGLHYFRYMEEEGLEPADAGEPTAAVPGIRSSLFPHLAFLKEKFPWFRLESSTEATVEAFEGLLSKVAPRLKDKKDLAAVAHCLTDLAGYLYTTIPGVSGTTKEKQDDALQAFARSSLASFSTRIYGLAPHVSEPRPEIPIPGFWGRARSRLSSSTAIFSHENTLICFVAWYGLTLILVLVGVAVAFYVIPTLKMDSTIVIAITTVPVASAAGALAVSRGRHGAK